MIAAPPLRLILVVVGGWMCARLVFMMLETVGVTPAVVGTSATAATVPIDIVERPSRAGLGTRMPSRPAPIEPVAALSGPDDGTAAKSSAFVESAFLVAIKAASEFPLAPSPVLMPSAPARSTGRWSVYSWLFLRDGRGGALATGGSLGRSQTGVRAVYRVTDRLAAAARVSAPLEGPGAEAAAGIEWTPIDDIPVRVLAERREGLDRGGRSAFALTIHGGLDPSVIGPLEVEVYGQAGMVGLRSRDLFVDGAVGAGVPLGDAVRIGGGVWGAAQPGVARLDVGPQIVARVPVGKVGVRAAAEWRFRVAGDAAPSSGPALTVSAGF